MACTACSSSLHPGAHQAIVSVVLLPAPSLASSRASFFLWSSEGPDRLRVCLPPTILARIPSNFYPPPLVPPHLRLLLLSSHSCLCFLTCRPSRACFLSPNNVAHVSLCCRIEASFSSSQLFSDFSFVNTCFLQYTYMHIYSMK